MEYVKYSYEKIASKLSSFVIQNQPVRLIACFSSSDPGRDRANLILLKQFGVVPVEVNIPQGDLNINMNSSLNSFDGLTVMIDSVLIKDHLSKDLLVKNVHHYSISKIPSKYQHLINSQTERLSSYFKQNQHTYTGGYIYISGFSILLPNTHPELLPETEFLPWYLQVDNNSNMSRVVRQPELNLFMQQITDVDPHILNLDEFLDQMRSWES